MDKYSIDKFQIIQEIKPLYYENDKPNGVFLVDKPAGITSHDVVDIARKYFKTKQVGHGGTLDPFATGAMIIAIGKETKSLNMLQDLDKEYEFEMVLGIQTISGDNQDNVSAVEIPGKDSLGDLENIQKLIDENFVKKILSSSHKYFQEVPLLSSVKVDGHKLRELMRNNIGKIEWHSKKVLGSETPRVCTFQKSGINIPIPIREVSIYSLNISQLQYVNYNHISQNSAEIFRTTFADIVNKKNSNASEYMEKDLFPVITGTVSVSSGTYIRMLVEDIAETLGSIGMLISLRRTKYFKEA